MPIAPVPVEAPPPEPAPSRRHRLTRAILAQAWPVLIGQWAAILYGVIDTVMTGHASPADLAAMALGASIYASVYIGLMGVVLGLNPIIAHHYGAQRHDAIGRAWMQGVWLALWLTVLGVTLMSFPDAWLVMSPVDDAVRERVGGYLHALSFALPAALLFRTVYALNTAVSRPKVVMAINLIGLLVKLGLNDVLIFGKLGLPALGATGCGVATAIVMWLSAGIGLTLLRIDRFYEPFTIRFAWPRWSEQKELLRLGVPTGLSYIVEVTSFTFMALLVARLGTSVTGGHQITANLAAFCYMVPLSLSIATATLTAQALGAGDARMARRSTLAGLRLAIGLALLLSVLLWFGRRALVDFYTSDAGVAAVALTLIPYLVGFHIFDAVQSVAGFVLRAYKHALAPLLIYSLALWGIGLVGGWWIAFHPVIGGAPLGARGLWLATLVSLAVAASALLAYLWWVSRPQRQSSAVAA